MGACIILYTAWGGVWCGVQASKISVRGCMHKERHTGWRRYTHTHTHTHTHMLAQEDKLGFLIFLYQLVLRVAARIRGKYTKSSVAVGKLEVCGCSASEASKTGGKNAIVVRGPWASIPVVLFLYYG